MTKLNCYSLSFSGANNNELLKEIILFLLGLKIDLREIHLCTEYSIMFFTTKKFDLLCGLIEDRFFDSAMIQFCQIKTSTKKKFLIKCSTMNKEVIDRFNELKNECL